MRGLEILSHWQNNSEDERGKYPMPPALYTSKEIHEIELDKIFKKEWTCAAHTSQLPNSGDFITYDIAGHPIIVLCDQDGLIKSYSNVCPHRSSRLLDGNGNIKHIVCPYHAWTYGLDGDLLGAPRMEKSQIAGVCLNELKTEIWNGLVFVSLGKNTPPLAPRLEPLNQHIRKYNFSSKQVVHSYDGELNCNWKVLVENFCESYHVFRVHKTTLEPDTPTSSVVVMPAGSGYNHHTMQIVKGKHLGQSNDQQVEHLSGIYPSTTFALSDKWAIFLSIMPLSHNKLTFRAWVAKDIAKGDDKALTEEELENILAFMAEDKVINTGVQKGLEAGVGNKGPLHEFEKTNWDFAHYYAKIMLNNF
ncbi:MAG: SRPBCC family protein [Emcibacteraceae bacterium]|nr:SRPBCC family protein [Emcibacteraceae bacterium]MDG1859672.1 SRPBCC family protein [Emcibacteraceae bacterium]